MRVTLFAILSVSLLTVAVTCLVDDAKLAGYVLCLLFWASVHKTYLEFKLLQAGQSTPINLSSLAPLAKWAAVGFCLYIAWVTGALAILSGFFALGLAYRLILQKKSA